MENPVESLDAINFPFVGGNEQECFVKGLIQRVPILQIFN